MRTAKKLAAILLLALWPAITSHALLESLGLIHEARAGHHHHNHHDGGQAPHEHEDTSNDHEFADGGYCASVRKTETAKDSEFIAAEPLLFEFIAVGSPTKEREVWHWDTATARPPPPEVERHWQFWFRKALPARAPSLS